MEKKSEGQKARAAGKGGGSREGAGIALPSGLQGCVAASTSTSKPNVAERAAAIPAGRSPWGPRPERIRGVGQRARSLRRVRTRRVVGSLRASVLLGNRDLGRLAPSTCRPIKAATGREQPPRAGGEAEVWGGCGPWLSPQAGGGLGGGLGSPALNSTEWDRLFCFKPHRAVCWEKSGSYQTSEGARETLCGRVASPRRPVPSARNP